MPRHNMYGRIHKGLRYAHGKMLTRLGQLDVEDAQGTTTLFADLRRQMQLSAKHLHHEDVVIHTAIEERQPGATAKLEADHAHHRATFEAIESAIAAVENAEPASRGDRARELYLAFSVFVAEDLEHMAHEEQVTQPLLHALFTDEELGALEHRIVSSQAPEDAIGFMQMMIPALSRPERLAFLGFAKASAPPPVFEAIMNFAARPTLAPADYQHLAEGLGIAA